MKYFIRPTNIVSFYIIYYNKIHKFVNNNIDMKNLVISIEKKVNNLISLYESIKKEKEEILNENDKLKKEMSEKDIMINNLEEKIKLLKITNSVASKDVDSNKESRQKINEYVREIDKCIALLNK